jgi:hypothetical protein
MLQEEANTKRPTPACFAERVVGERRQVHDRVKALKLPRTDVAHVELERRLEVVGLAEVAAAVEEAVEPGDIVPAHPQRRREHRADVAVVPRDEDSHRAALTRTSRPACDR